MHFNLKKRKKRKKKKTSVFAPRERSPHVSRTEMLS